MSQFLLTGANGFIGQALAGRLGRDGVQVCSAIRGTAVEPSGQHRFLRVTDDFADIGDVWPANLRADCVVHLAARVHVLDERAVDPLTAFRQTNVTGTLRVAEASARAGVRRFVYVSSIKAVAGQDDGTPLKESDVPRPLDPYGVSKLEAERALREYGAATGMEVVIVRPPLVYGPGVRANFLALMDMLGRGIPLPLGAVHARRSLISVDNLVDALVDCATRPEAAGQTFHVSDDLDLSVPELVRTLARHLQVPCRLIPVPVSWLRAAGRLTGRTEQVSRLVEGLSVDIRHIKKMLGWTPPISVDECLGATVDWYRANRR